MKGGLSACAGAGPMPAGCAGLASGLGAGEVGALNGDGGDGLSGSETVVDEGAEDVDAVAVEATSDAGTIEGAFFTVFPSSTYSFTYVINCW